MSDLSLNAKPKILPRAAVNWGTGANVPVSNLEMHSYLVVVRRGGDNTNSHKATRTYPSFVSIRAASWIVPPRGSEQPVTSNWDAARNEVVVEDDSFSQARVKAFV
jgi:hypothetical protein